MLDWIDRIVHAFALWFGGLVLFAMLGLTVFDVGGRYFLNWPVYGSLDLYGVLLASVVAVCLPYGQRTGAHVSADLFAALASPGVDRAITVVVRTLCAMIAGLWACYLYFAGNTAALLEESTQLLAIPFQPVYYILAVGIGIYAIALLAEAVTLATTGAIPLINDKSSATMASSDE
jgi:TRAP-type C4-dicarboxylate transport system permease small subunit